MKRLSISITRSAEEDLTQIERWWVREASSAIADRVLGGIEEKITRLADTAPLGASRPEYGQDVRFVRAKPYVIYYRIAENRVIVLRILHQARDRDAIMGGSSRD